MNDERELVAASRQGDLHAFNQLVERFQQRVFALCLRMLGQQSAAEDATQETFLSAFRAIKSFRGERFLSWLLRIAVNACYDELRRRKRRAAESSDIEDPPLAATLPSSAESPEAYVLRRELQHHIEQGLRGLPPDQRLVVILADVQGFSYEEVAEITRSPLGTVRSRLNRGRLKLRDYLLQESELLPARFRLKE